MSDIIRFDTEDAVKGFDYAQEVDIFALVEENDPILKTKLSEFDFSNPPDEIEVQYFDYKGQIHQQKMSGMTSHIFQHELDHLNGVVYTDRAKPLALKMGIKKRGKFNKLVERYSKAQKKIQLSTGM